MTKYKMTVLSFDKPVPTNNWFSNLQYITPWGDRSKGAEISFQGAEVGSFIVVDDDAFAEHGGVRDHTTPEDQQRLFADTTFGSFGNEQTLPAGTQLSFFASSGIKNAKGEIFYAAYPSLYELNKLRPPLAEGSAIVIIPRQHTNSETGDVYFPVFDPNEKHTFLGRPNDFYIKRGAPYAPDIIDCFATGTCIQTAIGPRKIETLVAGDLISTLDHGLQPLAWIGKTHLDSSQLDLRPNLRPIKISAGALGQSLPTEDLIVSPQHRVLIRSAIAQRMFDESEILVAAKHLVSCPGIEVMNSPEGITYWHLLFDRHEIVSSHGAWTESLFTGRLALQAVSDQARGEIFSLFPELDDHGYQPKSARKLLTGREGRKLAERHSKNAKSLLEPVG